jgi:hypothetical protein
VIRVFSGVPEGFRTPRGKLWALLGHTGNRGAGHKGCCAPPLAGPNWTRGWGGRNTPLSFSLFPSSFPSWWTPTRSRIGLLLLPPLYTEEGHPLETHNCPIAVCGAPISVFHLGHIFGELRRSPAGITSPSPSPRRRADGTHLLPRHLAGSRRRGTSPSCTCVELGGAVRSVLDRWSSKDCSTTSTAL